ncbi:M20/M25/M40 family metallo-hydrolase [Altererythrobacter aurantiacus]|uniref:Carboxypeptidase Q n=1 Tax=Parapontixanthobacter aurantiacus TaxID=1463599 RepID=A0A844ZCL8_9SPHN|nr:M20/M25/M40 family metallo-hydrolase [Parapontixanthobacter aurantiacus]MXO84913.1 M20/M25/M40 family metallo-hydrolase [Parapontixanthobacter aurantiacus]
MDFFRTFAAPVALVALAINPAEADAQATGSTNPQAERALSEDTIAYDFVEGITTEVGPRQAGTEAEARGRVWAERWLTANDFTNVADEPFMMDTWVRGEEEAEIVSPFAQPLAIAALGNSASTGPDGITAEVVYFPTYAALQAAPEGSLAGKIAFISHAMSPTQDGSQYGFAGPARWTGPSLAASKGAVATVIRSVGTDYHRNPHTGGTTFAEGVEPIPAGALSLPDADNLIRMFERANGRAITMKLVLTPRLLGETQSGNVVGEIVGRDPSLPPVLLACHLDSWDLGTGAFDDAAGCGIVAAAAKHVAEAGQPLRTIRVLFAGAEETGLWGSKAYAAAHADEPIAVALESDFGADRIWRFDSNFTESNPDLYRRIAAAVAPFGVAPSAEVATGGADINIARERGTAIIDLQQDGTRYFDLHHTPDDTLDKIDPAQLRQNVAVWTAVTAILANEPRPIKPSE